MALAASGETMSVKTPLGSALKITTLSGQEGISQPFELQLGLVASNHAPVPFDALVGQPMSVKVGGRYFNGIVQRFGEGARGTSGTSYTAYLVPSMWLLTRSRNSRIFQQMSVKDILSKLFTGLPLDDRTEGTYEKRDYCVQYRETDFDFVSRLMEEEGIFYFFEHTSTGHTLVLGDNPLSLSQLSSAIVFDRTGATRKDAGVIYAWEKDQALRSGLMTLRDYGYQTPNDTLEVQAQIQDSVLAGTVTHHLHIAGNDGYEVFDYPADVAKRYNGPTLNAGPSELRTVGIRMQEEALPSLLVTGGSNTEMLTAGYGFTLANHFDANGDWVITSVDHSAHATKPNGPVTYTNDFTAIPAGLPFVPARTTPRPMIPGVQTAFVVGPAGETIYVDQYGRIKVQFHWDRQGKNDANSSCWIRVGHPVADPASRPPPPPIGTEVIVAFEDGDPDKPIIVGTTDFTQGPTP